MWADYYTRTARVARKIWTKDETACLVARKISEGMWRAMGWVCDQRPNAMINTLNHVFKWRSTKWWQSTEAIETKNGWYNHTRWKHMWGPAQPWGASRTRQLKGSAMKTGPVKGGRCQRIEDKKNCHLCVAVCETFDHTQNKNCEEE